MRQTISILLLILISSFVYAQQITGSVKDDNGAPLIGATVSLIKAIDSSTVKLAITKTNGSYIFSGIKEGIYKTLVSYIGYKPTFSETFFIGLTDMTVPEIKVSRVSGDMNNVTVIAKKPIIEVKADKMILNVEGTTNSIGSNALELLRKAPGVLLDKDDNISLSGKNGVQVYIDGRSIPLSGQELANYLKSLQSTQVEAIELITNPSAKYDAAGNAGIINIRLLKNKSLGTNGSVNAGWNMGITAKYNLGGSLNYRNKKLNIFTTYSYNYAPNISRLTSERTVLDSLFNQSGTIRDVRRSHNFKAGTDYFLNKKNTIGLMVNGIISDPTSTTFTRTRISNKATSAVDRILVADNNTNSKRHNANINLNYNYNDLKGASLVVNADRGSFDFNSDQLQRNYYYDPTGQVKQGSVIYHMISPAQININSIKADYEQNLWKGKLGIGAKSAFVKTDNNFTRSNVYITGEEVDKDRSNHFVYKENINAGYVNYNRQYKKFMIQGGLRVENTVVDGVSNGLKLNGSSYIPITSSFTRSYTDMFPSAAITFNKNPMKQWSLTYSHRIDRPAYKDLNPFEFKLDEYTSMKGNINLRPQYTNSFGITHTYKYKLNMALNYSHVKDLITEIIDTVNKSRAFLSKRNLATQDIVSITASYPFQYKSFNLFTSISSNYSKYNADFGNGRNVDLRALGFNLFVQNSIKFCKTWTAELSGFYNAPTVVMGTFKARSMYNVDAGISKQIFKGKSTIKASVSDIFYSQQFRATSNFAGQTMKVNFRGESQQFKLSMNFRFGNTGVNAARQRTTGAEEELKRVQ